jgi:hypothetical protein
VGEDRPREVGDRDVHARRAEICHEQVAGVGTEADEAWSTPAGRRAQISVGQHAVIDQLTDTLRDDGTTEPRRVHQAGS